MKLATHYNRASIFITIVVLMAGALIYYFAIRQITRDQLDREIAEEIAERIDYVNRNGKIPKNDFDDNLTEFIKINSRDFTTRFFDSVYYNGPGKMPENRRAAAALITVAGQNYKLIITESYSGINNLLQIITLITVVLLIVLLLILLITNKYVLTNLWLPFYNILHELKTFNVADPKDFSSKPNGVDEFNELNTAVQIMASRVKNDYLHLKQFTENASHEMMTPLAVITTKLDTLIQDENLNADQYTQINDIYSAAAKLSRLNHALLLLVKIENNLVNDEEALNLQSLITQKLQQFKELIAVKDITVIEVLKENRIVASKTLIDILLNNLFSNAIRHNIEHGKLLITLTKEKLVFENPGADKPLDKDMLFERFQKAPGSDGVGLGLTIVKNICQLYHWDINYSHQGSLHRFEIVFNKDMETVVKK
ncbi:sensor histidine kinase [Mucilaginibacter flavidus]|uniref:sensor histidine kinase n=1 Tax=Mucilaginibacter flavidus TaxID=2949309 RepID=UPI002092C662|nr:HAMP domain-containing sensor histidine kinase [Mucilaginibacter flavidus]MCO5949035.1 HAMP domain-containing histidine kinase [Mucilaginibacter flavidus]